MTPIDQLYNHGLMAGRLNTKEAPLFGQHMATLRQRKGFTQMQLAARMNTTQKMIDYYERRSPNPTLDVMQKIAGVTLTGLPEFNSGSALMSRACTLE